MVISGMVYGIGFSTLNEITLHLLTQIAMKAAYRLATGVLLDYMTITINNYEMMLSRYILSISFIVLYSTIRLQLMTPFTVDCRVDYSSYCILFGLFKQVIWLWYASENNICVLYPPASPCLFFDNVSKPQYPNCIIDYQHHFLLMISDMFHLRN